MKNSSLVLTICGGLILMFAGFGLMFGGLMGALIAIPVALVLALPITGIVLLATKGKDK